MAKNKVLQGEDIRIPCGVCDFIAKRDEGGDVRMQSVVGTNVLTEILIPANAVRGIADYLSQAQKI